MKWTDEQLEYWKRQQARRDNPPDVGRPGPIMPKPRMNQTEARFAEYLEQLRHFNEIRAWRFEPMKFELAANVPGKRNATTYTPDFMAVSPRCFTFYEVKGFFRDDAIVKLKVAAELHPWFAWFAVFWKKGEWVFKEM